MGKERNKSYPKGTFPLVNNRVGVFQDKLLPLPNGFVHVREDKLIVYYTFPTVAKWWGFFFLTTDSCSYIHGIRKENGYEIH